MCGLGKPKPTRTNLCGAFRRRTGVNQFTHLGRKRDPFLANNAGTRYTRAWNHTTIWIGSRRPAYSRRLMFSEAAPTRPPAAATLPLRGASGEGWSKWIESSSRRVQRLRDAVCADARAALIPPPVRTGD